MFVSIGTWLEPTETACSQCGKQEFIEGLVGQYQVAVELEGVIARTPSLCTTCLETDPQTAVAELPDGRRVPSKQVRRQSRKQERQIMEGIGGRASKASGAMPSDKGDGRLLNRVRMEAKLTYAAQYTLKRSDLTKLRGECKGKEEPAFIVDFMDRSTGRVEDRWAIVPHHVWEKLINATADDR